MGPTSLQRLAKLLQLTLASLGSSRPALTDLLVASDRSHVEASLRAEAYKIRHPSANAYIDPVDYRPQLAARSPWDRKEIDERLPFTRRNGKR
jgi:hypothetical protein